MTQIRLVSVRPVDLGKSDHRGLLATYGFGSFTFTALSANLQYTDNATDLRTTVAKVASYGAVVINHQEAMTPTQRDAIDALVGYETFWPGGRDKAGKPKASPMNYNPISYRTDTADLIKGDWHEAHKGLFRFSPTRGVSEAILDLAGVLVFDSLNVHTVNGVDGAGKVPKAWRRRMHKRNLALVARLLEARAKVGPVAASGDFNTTRLRTLLPLPGAIFDVPNAGTHGSRLIDWWVRPATHAEPTPEAPVTQKRLNNLADVLRGGGLKVVEIDGWKTRSRPESSGGFNPVGVLCHHTATGKGVSDNAVIQLLIKGRADLPGPLCNLGLGRDGTVYVISAGRANHAGKAKASGTVAAGDGNALYVGIEAFNDGVGEAWPAVQYDAYVRTCAVLSQKITGNSVNTVRGHKETSVTGKVDPRFDMDKFRADVAKAIKPAAPKPPATKPKPKPASRFQQMYDTADSIARDKDYTARKRAAAVIIRTAAAPFVKEN